MTCTYCHQPITSGVFYGDGDGTGQRFIHAECLAQRDSDAYADAMAREQVEREAEQTLADQAAADIQTDDDLADRLAVSEHIRRTVFGVQ